ncbi:hypothetical protein Tco_0629365 [Tanacetum coccineum]|uniref:Uncharacterized protein n=1 Tax=Tanacetum coccineum TaxID=301880 RepID=A0ABQ4WT63_9ASTR
MVEGIGGGSATKGDKEETRPNLVTKVVMEVLGRLLGDVVKSAAAKMARSKSVYQHTMGRGGYAHMKEKMKETDDKIKEGTLKVDHGTDAMTVVLGKEKGGYERGVGSGVTYKRYFDLPRSRQASDERIMLLQSQLDNERRELAFTRGAVEINVNSNDTTRYSSADEEGRTPVVGCENDASIQKSNGLATSEKEMETRETVNSVVSKKTTRSIQKVSSRQDSQSQENVSPLLVLPQGLESVSIRRIQGIGYDVLGFLGVGITFDIFQNIHILCLQYGVLVFSGYSVLNLSPLWSLVSAGTDTPYTVYWLSE